MISKEEAQKIAKKYIIWNIGNLPGVGEPYYSKLLDKDVWVVPITLRTKELSLDSIEKIIIDSKTGEMIKAPVKGELKKIIELCKKIEIKFPRGIDAKTKSSLRKSMLEAALKSVV